MNLVIDMETRSKVDLKNCGVYKYAEDESTDILCIALKADNEESMLWIPSYFLLNIDPDRLNSLDRSDSVGGHGIISDSNFKEMLYADKIIAHNATFEMVLWREIMVKRYGFPSIELRQWKCTAAKAAAHALPRSLEKACLALDLDQQKDTVGKRIMMKWCKPRKPTKSNTEEWHDDREEFAKLCGYCIQDVEAEYQLDKALHDLSEKETEVWRHDQVINSRGVYVDIPAINNLISKVKLKETKLLKEVESITCGEINSVRQVVKTREYLAGRGVVLPNLQVDTVTKALKKPNMDYKAKRLLEIRQSLSKSSVSKLDTMTRRACKDSRVRGSIMYHGASTGRYSGKGIQPQNYPRASYSTFNIETILKCDNDLLEILYDCPIPTASKCLRGMLRAAPGKEFFCFDFSSIEGRVLAWLSDEKYIVENYRAGVDPYIYFASQIHNTPYAVIKKGAEDGVKKYIDMRFDGKTGELACGYQGWVGAIAQFAPDMPEEKAKEIVIKWREGRPMTKAYWKSVEKAAMDTVLTGHVNVCGRIKFGTRGRFLHIRLPSGRLLSYYDPKIVNMVTGYGVHKKAVSYMSVNSKSQWVRVNSYGGKWVENITQAIARDVMGREAMLSLEANGFPVCLHAHDEITAELPKGSTRTMEEFREIMVRTPGWAEGLPLAAEGWRGVRYRK